MAMNATFANLLERIRTAIYGKDVREAIASSIEICYTSSSGDVALDAATAANEAAERATTISNEVNGKLADLDTGLASLDNIVMVSDTQPEHPRNKIWVQRQDDTEYKIPTFAAYEALWSRIQTFAETYQQGHGGIVSIEENTSYSNPQDALEREYVVTYSDGTTATFHLRNGERGATGPVDQITNTEVKYHKGIIQSGALVPTPPSDGWTNTLPALGSGDYLWTETIVTYQSGAKCTIYGITRMGVDGSGAVNSVAIGSSGSQLTGDIVLPVDSTPTGNSGNLMTSGGIYAALSNILDNTALRGTPTAPTAATSTTTTQIATTAFVHNVVSENVFELRRISVLMTSSPFTYQSSDITANTYCLFTGDITVSINWTTSEGLLSITASDLPVSGISFDVIMLETAPVE